MTNLTEKFTTLAEQLEVEHETEAALTGVSNALLDDIKTQLLLLNSNNSANFRYLLNAIGQNNPCIGCEGQSIFTPPTDTEGVPIDEEHCKRVQAFLHAMSTILAGMDTLMSADIAATSQFISDAFTQILATLGSGDTIPLPSLVEASNIAGSYIVFASTRFLTEETLSGVFAPMFLDLRAGMFTSSDAAGAQTAFNSVIDSSEASAAARTLISVTGYNALFSYYFDPESEPDLTGYDGTVCTVTPGSCYTLVAVPFSQVGGGSAWSPNVPFGPFTPVDGVMSSSGPITFTEPVFYAGDLAGWTSEVLEGLCYLQYREGGLDSTQFFQFTANQTPDGIPRDLPADTGTFHFEGPAAFTVRVCYSPEV